MQTEFEWRALKGMRLIDAHGGVEDIDTGILDMRNTLLCVLGQRFGAYGDGLTVLSGIDFGDWRERTDFAVENGFDLPAGSSDEDFARLKAAWVRLIEQARQPRVYHTDGCTGLVIDQFGMEKP